MAANNFPSFDFHEHRIALDVAYVFKVSVEHVFQTSWW